MFLRRLRKSEALDVQNIHLPVKSKYNCLTLIARTLQEDPSCQLNLVLHKYAMTVAEQDSWQTLESRLVPCVILPLATLKQGVIVLSRQWKNALYTPFMLTYTLRLTSNKVPINRQQAAKDRCDEHDQVNDPAHVQLDDGQAPITGQQIVESTEEEAAVQDKVEDVVDVQKTGQDCQVVEQADVASQVPSESALADGKAEEAVSDPVNQVAQVAEDTDDCRCHSDSARSCDSSSRR